MKLTDINIRDPYILCSGDWYYMYGTRAETCWGAAEGFDCFKSKDLENWEGPFEIFHRPEGFWQIVVSGLRNVMRLMESIIWLPHLAVKNIRAFRFTVRYTGWNISDYDRNTSDTGRLELY